MKIIEALAQCFLDVFYTGKFSGDPSFDISEVSLDQAYRVQDSVTQQRIDKGEAVAGYKIGCTSFAIQSQLGLKESICGKLFAP